MAKYFTLEGVEKLKKELNHLEKVARKEVSEKIRLAAAQGDLKENAGYHAAKEQQGFIEGRIKELKEILSQVKITDNKKSDIVQIGSQVHLESLIDKEKETFKIVEPEEADVLNNKISFKSPLGSAIFKKKKGSIVQINTPQGSNKYKIINIK